MKQELLFCRQCQKRTWHQISKTPIGEKIGHAIFSFGLSLLCDDSKVYECLECEYEFED